MSTPIIAFIPSVYEVTVTSKTIVQKMLKRGNRPSLYQIDQWFEKGYTVCITEKTKIPPIKGRIKQVGPYRINECGEADILIEGHPFPIAIKDIKHFEVEEITNFPVPMILAPSSPLVNKIQTVVLVSDGERFIVNKQRLADIVPYF